MKIVVDQNLCIGAASCVAIGAQTFGLNQEGKVFILNESKESSKIGSMSDVVESESTNVMDTRDIIIEAARSCPTFAIKLFEDDGTEIVL
jgi:ferredoxin